MGTRRERDHDDVVVLETSLKCIHELHDLIGALLYARAVEAVEANQRHRPDADERYAHFLALLTMLPADLGPGVRSTLLDKLAVAYPA
jgi:hypothetical protein